MSLCYCSMRAQFMQGLAMLVTVWQWVFFSPQALAQRDPTVPPPTLVAPAASDSPVGLALESGGVSVLRRDGVVYLMLGTRVYAQGQTVGMSTIERISETEVWLRENGKVRKVPLFGGIVRRVAPAQRAMPVEPPALSTPVMAEPTGAEFEL